MISGSAREANSRPFYASQADAYDLLIDAPVDGWVDQVSEVRATGSLLDAGCGTGRHAQALSQRGFSVEILDASVALLAQARRRCPDLAAHLVDICDFDLGKRFDIVACRGVLNDMLTDDQRADAVNHLAGHVARDGVLILDVRDYDQTRRAAGARQSKEALLPDGRVVRFTSRTSWQEPLLRVTETHEVASTEGERPDVETYEFAMRPWSEQELSEVLLAAGLRDVEVRRATYRATTDRLLAIASG